MSSHPKVIELRERLGDKLPPLMRPDEILMRWLVARNFNVDLAENMILKHLKWRKKWDVDSVLDWTPPEVLRKYHPYGISGYDRSGSPVWILTSGRFDCRGLSQSTTQEEILRMYVKFFETSLKVMREKSEELGFPVTNHVAIFDMDNFSLWQIANKSVVNYHLLTMKIYEDNYPEVLKRAYVINTPKIFLTFFNLIKRLLTDVTLNKIKMFGRSGWQEAIFENIDRSQIPVYWGGTMRDPDGDVKCPSKITWCEKIPENYYLKNQAANESNERNYPHSLLLRRGTKKVIEIEVEKSGAELWWGFCSDGFDVGFSLTSVHPSGEECVLIPDRRVNCHLEPEEGSLICETPGTYKITFNNSHSYVRPKNLHYDYRVMAPNSNPYITHE